MSVVVSVAWFPAQATEDSTKISVQESNSAVTVANGAVAGVVRDASGAVVPGANVIVSRCGGAPLDRTTVSGADGSFQLKDLPVGVCSLTISVTGFKTFESGDLQIVAGSATPLVAVLELASEVTSVNVESQRVAQVETESADVSGTITQKEVVKLGLNGRNFTQLIALAPGVSNQTGQDEAKVGVTGSVKYSVNGGRVEYNTFDVDGSDVLNAGLNGAESTLVVYPSLDAIQEVKVLTSNYGAMFGRTASGTVLVTTKSGTDKFHGNAYEFLRNEAFNARNYFDQTAEAPLYRRNDFGGTLGGPLFIPGVFNTKKDKTYFFFSEEFRYERSPQEFNQAVPSLAERGGDFSDVCPSATDPKSGYPFFVRSKFPDCPGLPSGQGKGFTVFPFNQLTGNGGVLNRNALAILSTGIIPAPNATKGCNSPVGSCYSATVSPSTTWREELFRIDHAVTNSNRLSLRYIHDSWQTTTPTPQWAFQQSSFPTIQNSFVGPGISAVVRLTSTISPTLLNQLWFSYVNADIRLKPQNGPGAQYQRPAALDAPCATDVQGNTQCPIGYLVNNGFGGKIPGVVIGGTNAAYGGNGFVEDAAFSPWSHTNPIYTLADGVSKAVGKHTLQFGVTAQLYQRNQTNGAIGAATGELQGILNFTNVNNFKSLGNAFADFLSYSSETIGAVRSFTQDSSQQRYYQRYTLAEPYFQDDWKVTPRFTLNMGLRLSLFGTFHEKSHSVYNFDPRKFNPSLAGQLSVDPFFGDLRDTNSGSPIPLNIGNLDPRITNGLVRCGGTGVPASCMKGHLFNFAPRLGFAWDPTGRGKTSIRAGYGIFYEHGTGDEANTGSLEGSAPLVLTQTQNFPSGWSCIGGVDPNCGRTGAFPLSVTAIPNHAVWPYSQQWSLSLQQELPKGIVATFAYVGSKGTHLTAERQINQLAPLAAAFNPFGPHEPILPTVAQQQGDCAGDTGGSFILKNGSTVGVAQPAFINLLAACYGTLLPGVIPDPNALRPYSGYNRIFSLENVANSSYNAFQSTLRRTAGPLTLGVSYSYSHSLDNSSDRSDATFVNSYDLNANRASSNFDQRHLLNISYIYKIPFSSRNLRDRYDRWGASLGDATAQKALDAAAIANKTSGLDLLDRIFAGWEISGITVYQSGTPFSVINGGSSAGISVLDNAGVANGAGAGSYPDVVGDPHARAPAGGNNASSIGPLLGNPAAFAAPRGLTFGTAGRNFLNNPSRINFDAALQRHFKLRESVDLEFRAEAFNLFNHTQFRIYDSNLGNTANNTISCYGPGAYATQSASSTGNLSGPDFSAAGGDANVSVLNNDGTVTTTSQHTDCLKGSSFLHPVNAHRPRTIQFGLKISF